ncbi:MAG: hypothetical protein NT001_06075 [Candidatus Woesearchaeota archaeon]|nr:hypothetical protein [Candidatus Woesearchaeota archaeon]
MKKFKKSKKRMLEAQPIIKGEKKSSKTLWMSIFICAIMVLSAIAFMSNRDDSSNSNLKYNNFSFSVTEDNKWILNLKSPEKQQITFYNHPSQVEQINVTPEISSILASTKMIYVTSDPDDLFKDAIGLAEFEMKDIMEKRGVYFVYSFIKENRFNKTIITCRNSTSSVPVLYFRQGNETGISYDDNCIILESDSESGILRLRDRMLYDLLGVIR